MFAIIWKDLTGQRLRQDRWLGLETFSAVILKPDQDGQRCLCPWIVNTEVRRPAKIAFESLARHNAARLDVASRQWFSTSNVSARMVGQDRRLIVSAFVSNPTVAYLQRTRSHQLLVLWHPQSLYPCSQSPLGLPCCPSADPHSVRFVPRRCAPSRHPRTGAMALNGP